MKALLVAGEASGDLYGGELISALRRRLPSLEVASMGGDQMALAGADLLYHYRDVAVVGVFEVFRKLVHLKRAYSRIRRWIFDNKPDFAVLIDFPDFNFRLVRYLRRQRIKTFYFISPQVWAWRKHRIHFLRDHIDLMICILPFESDLYTNAGVPVTYVGHPLVEFVREEVDQQPSFPRGSKPLVGLMPGSREIEVRRHLPILLDTIRLIRQTMDIDVVVIWPPWLTLTGNLSSAGCRVEQTHRYAAMKACDLLLVASGTSTLEAAILGVPLFIVYRVGPISWQLGKILVRVPYYGLVNWIAQDKRIPEYIQEAMNPKRLSVDAVKLLRDERLKLQMKEELGRIISKLGPPGAMERVADTIINRI